MTSTKASKEKGPLFDRWTLGHTVIHSNTRPLHIIGHGRSGTSLMGALCRVYFGIGIGTESQFIIRYFKSLHSYGDLNHDSNIKLLIRNICSERYFTRSHKFAGFQPDPEKIFRQLRERTFSGILNTTFSQLAEHLGMSKWGDKSPEYVHDLPILHKLFPDAQYIHMVRDGRDVAMSSIKEPLLHVNNIYTAAKEWGENLALTQSFLQEIPPERYLEVRYEDLLHNPKTVMLEIMEFLGIKDLEGRVTQSIIDNINKDIAVNNFNKWKTTLTKAQIRLYEQVAGDALTRYGYETQRKKQHPIAPASRIFWWIHNEMNKIGRPKVWAENFYKTKLRLNRTLVPIRLKFKTSIPGKSRETSTHILESPQ